MDKHPSKNKLTPLSAMSNLSKHLIEWPIKTYGPSSSIGFLGLEDQFFAKASSPKAGGLTFSLYSRVPNQSTLLVQLTLPEVAKRRISNGFQVRIKFCWPFFHYTNCAVQWTN
jgi:hypothetical protein